MTLAALSAAPSPVRFLRRAARKLLPAGWLVAPGLRQVLGLRRGEPHPVDEIAGLQIEYSLTSLIGQQLYLNGSFEDDEAQFLGRRLTQWPSPGFLDLGANIGLHCLRVASEVPLARVVAFEPARETFALLERNIARNGLGARVAARPLAVGRESGRATFHYCRDDAYSSLVPDGRRPVDQSYEVDVVSLDDWLAGANFGHVHLIKLDVEGGEMAVIAGAPRILQEMRPELVVEIFQGTRPPGFADDLIGQICAYGYDPFVLKAGQPEPFARHDDEHFNYFFQPRA
jgi:FkbM family methyltransferase